MTQETLYRWVKASERLPEEDNPESLEKVTFREIESQKPITRIWKFHKDCIELENGSSICGQEIPYSDVEWLEPLQEINQEEQENARNIIAENLYSISDVFGNRLLPPNKCDDMAETFLSDLTKQYLLIKR